MLVIFGILYVRTHNPMWRQLSVFWVRVYGLVFAMGIATGVVQEFEFGMNWATTRASWATSSGACWRPRAFSPSFWRAGSWD